MNPAPVAPNRCWDPGCPHQGQCVRWYRPVDPGLGESLFPAEAEIDDPCPYLLERDVEC